MGLTDKKEDQLRRMPIVESKISKSQDGKLLIHRTIITDIKPVGYYKAVAEGTESVEAEKAEV